MRRPFLTPSILGLTLGLTGAASAAITATPFETDAARFDFFVPSTEQAVAEARFGNGTTTGDWELGVGRDTQQTGEFTQAQNAWGNAATEAFTIFYDASTLELFFTVGDEQIGFTPLGPLTVNDVAFRIGFGDGTESGDPNTGNAVDITSLEIDGVALEPSSLTSAFDESGARYLFVEDAFSLGSDFTITGDLSFAWSIADNGLAGSRPSFQVKFVNAIPEPASLAVLAAGLAAMLRRR